MFLALCDPVRRSTREVISPVVVSMHATRSEPKAAIHALVPWSEKTIARGSARAWADAPGLGSTE